MDHSSTSFDSLLSSLIAILFLTHQPSSSSSPAVATAASTAHFLLIFAFGDSFTNTGTTQSASGFLAWSELCCGGITAIHHGFFVRNNVTINTTLQALQTELVWFNKVLVKEGCTQLGSAPCRRLVEDSLFWLGEMGANDYAYISDLSIMPTRIEKLAMKSDEELLVR